MKPKIVIDQDRIAARYVELLAEARQQAATGWLMDLPSRRTRIFGRRSGKSLPPLPPPWKEMSPGVWTAPSGTPEPFVSRTPPTVEQMSAWMADLPVIDADTMRPPGYLTADEMADLLRESDVDQYRKTWAEELSKVEKATIITNSPAMSTAWTGGDPVEDLRAWQRRIKDMDTAALPPHDVTDHP
jgi:hypothetical protein